MFRSTLVLCAIPAGLAAGVLAWLSAGGATASTAKLAPVRTMVAGIALASAPGRTIRLADGSELAALPLFPLTNGPGATPQPTLQLDGLVRSRGRLAALLSINGKPAEWLGVGEARDGVTLQDVQGSKVTVDTVYGPQEVALGDRPQPGLGSPPVAPITGQALDQVPPGFRSPPPPASAPAPR